MVSSRARWCRLGARAAAAALPVGALASGALPAPLPFSPALAEGPGAGEADDASQKTIDGLRSQLADASAELSALRQRAAEAAASDAEAARLQQAVQRQEEEDSLKLLRLLQQQEAVWESVTADKLRAAAADLRAEAAAASDALRAELGAQHEAALSARAEEIEADFEARLEVLQQNERAAHEAARAAEAAERLGRLAALHEDLAALDSAYSCDNEYKRRAHQVQRLCAALFALDEARTSTHPDAPALGAALAAVADAAEGDELVGAALASLPDNLKRAARVPTTKELQERFELVASQGRVAAYVPEGTGVFGQLLGAAVASLSFKEKGLVEPADAAAVFSRAEYYVAREQPGAAVLELRQLRGLPAGVAADWAAAAAERCALDQALTVLRAHATTLACALA